MKQIGVGHDRVVGNPGIDDPLEVVAHARGKTPLGDLLTNYELVWATTNLGNGTRASCSSLEGGTGGVAGSGVGFVLLVAGLAGMTWAESANKFFEPTVRIQSDRGHTVIDTGPYAVVRHPGYVASYLLILGMPLALGSLWALSQPSCCARCSLCGRSWRIGRSGTSCRVMKIMPSESVTDWFPASGSAVNKR
jgi:hypothetical protein